MIFPDAEVYSERLSILLLPTVNEFLLLVGSEYFSKISSDCDHFLAELCLMIREHPLEILVYTDQGNAVPANGRVPFLYFTHNSAVQLVMGRYEILPRYRYHDMVPTIRYHDTIYAT
jgi:hypothetical protein